MIINLTNVPRVSLGCQLELHDRYRFIVNTWKTERPRRLQKPRGTRPVVRCATYWTPDQKPVVRTEAIGNPDQKPVVRNRSHWKPPTENQLWKPKQLEQSTKNQSWKPKLLEPSTKNQSWKPKQWSHRPKTSRVNSSDT